jgi:hypothetical protein
MFSWVRRVFADKGEKENNGEARTATIIEIDIYKDVFLIIRANSICFINPPLASQLDVKIFCLTFVILSKTIITFGLNFTILFQSSQIFAIWLQKGYK